MISAFQIYLDPSVLWKYSKYILIKNTNPEEGQVTSKVLIKTDV